MSSTHLPVPYLSNLEGNGLQPGQSVCVKGTVFGQRFDINFVSGRAPSDNDLPLHVSVRLDEKKFVLNNRKGGEWGKEERKGCPYKEGDPVDIRIRAHDQKFEVLVNQKELAEFDYRAPLSQIQSIFINGEIELHSVLWGGKYYTVPYEAGIEGGLGAGKRLFISGVPLPEGSKEKHFAINLKTRDGQTALHFNPRFNEKAVVRNSKLAGAWGNEEREGKFPFVKEKVFDMVFVNEQYSFQIFIDGQQFCTFAHRTDPNSIHVLNVEGEVELQGIHVK